MLVSSFSLGGAEFTIFNYLIRKNHKDKDIKTVHKRFLQEKFFILLSSMWSTRPHFGGRDGGRDGDTNLP